MASRFNLEEKGGLSGKIGLAIVAQGISLVSSIMMTVVVPKALGLEDYAYWQLFTLYVGYIGLLLLGVHDGAFLRLGGASVDGIDWPRIKAQFAVIASFQVVALLCVGVGLAAFGDGTERMVVFLCVVIDGLIVNPAAFLFYFLQAVNLPNIHSLSSMLSGGIWAVLLVVLTVLNPEGFFALCFGGIYSANPCRPSIATFIFGGYSNAKWVPCAMLLLDCRDDCFQGSQGDACVLCRIARCWLLQDAY